MDKSEQQMEFHVNDPNQDDYKFPKKYRTLGDGKKVHHHVASMFGNYSKKKLKWSDSRPESPHVLKHFTGAEVWNWNILSPEDLLSAQSDKNSDTVLKSIYDNLNLEITKRAKMEGSDKFILETPDKNIELTRAAVQAAAIGNAKPDYLKGLNISTSDIPKMLEAFKTKQPTQWAELTRSRPLHQALPVKKANAKIDKKWSNYFDGLYNTLYANHMKALVYHDKRIMEPSSDLVSKREKAAARNAYGHPVVFELSYEGWGLKINDCKNYGIVDPSARTMSQTFGRRDKYLKNEFTARKVATAIARDTGICLTANIGSVWMQAFYDRLAAKALLKGGTIGLTENDLGAAEAEALGDVLSDPSLDLTKADTTGGMDAETIKNRFKFYKQCALLGNMEILADSQNKYVVSECNNKQDAFHNTGVPYNGRFWMIQDGSDIAALEASQHGPPIPPTQVDQNGLSTKMLMPRSSRVLSL